MAYDEANIQIYKHNKDPLGDPPYIFLFGTKIDNCLSCRMASSLEPFSYCLVGAITVNKHLQYVW